jgi:hypothetical protein
MQYLSAGIGYLFSRCEISDGGFEISDSRYMSAGMTYDRRYQISVPRCVNFLQIIAETNFLVPVYRSLLWQVNLRWKLIVFRSHEILD